MALSRRIAILRLSADVIKNMMRCRVRCMVKIKGGHSPQFLYRFLIGTGILLVLLIVFAVLYWLRISKYVKVDAAIVSVDTYTTSGVGDSQDSKEHFITWGFTYNDIPYQVTEQVFSVAGKQIGDRAVLRCNPEHPEQIEKKMLIRLCCIGIVFLLLLDGVLLAQLIQQKGRG